MGRFLDVLRQHVRALGVCLLVVPLAVGAGAFLLDRASVVEARIRVSPASFVTDSLADVLRPWDSRADFGGALIGELLDTEWFRERVLSDPRLRGSIPSPQERDAEWSSLRRGRRITSDGPSVVSVAYSTNRPEKGVAVLGALVRSVGGSIRTIESDRAATALHVASDALRRARADMEVAIGDAQRYANLGGSTVPISSDPRFLRLMAYVEAATAHYQRVDALVHEASVTTAAAPQVGDQTLTVLDAPRAEPDHRVALARRWWALTLVGTAALGVLAIYAIALHDPRLRALDDLRQLVPTARLAGEPMHTAAVGDALSVRLAGGVVSIISPHRGDGRSTVAAELARALRDQGHDRVLLVDLDTGPDPTAVDDLLRTVIETGLLGEYRAAYAWTVVDLPPLLDAPGAAAVAARSDGTVLVGRYRTTRVDALRRAVGLLPAPPLGCVMTGVKELRARRHA